MSIYGSKRKYRKGPRSQLGHLKLSIYEEASALVVTIFEARGLLRRDNTPLDIYVKLYLLPDPQKETKEKTRNVKQRDPVFNQKFSFLLSEQDQARRLFISVWSHHSTSRNEMIGCMSFLVVDLLGPNKGLNGWYQLLDEEKGLAENIQVPTSVSKYESSYGHQSPGRLTFAVTLVRSAQGYGFSVHGYSPVFVTQVEEGLPAHSADLQVGDVIMEVEGTDVLRASGDLVVNIVRKCPETLHLILYRDNNSTHLDPHPYPHQPTPTKTTPTTPPTTLSGVEGGATFVSPLSSQPFLSQSFTSMRSVPPGGGSSGGGAPGSMSALSRAHYSSQQVMSNRSGGRRFSSPQGPSPVHHAHQRHFTHGGYSQPTDYVYGGGIGYYNQHMDVGLLYSHDPAVHTHSHPRSRGSSSHGRSSGHHDQIPEDSAASYEHRSLSRQRRSDVGSGGRPGAHSRKSSAPGLYTPGQYHEPTLTNSGVDRLALTQPESDVFGPPPVRHTVASKHPLPHTHFEKYSMSQVDAEIADRGAYGRFSPTRPAGYTPGGGYQSRALFSNKAMVSNGSIAGDSAYASGLSNQSGSTRSPVDMEETAPKYGGSGMRSEERGSAHPGGRALSKSSLSGSRDSSHGNLHHGSSAASRSSLTGSRDSAHFGRGPSVEEEGLVDWETLLPLEQKRQRAINSVMNAELSFLKELQVGMETYMEPLYNILPDTAHHSIFLYLDELFTLCQEIIAQLQARRLPYTSQNTPIPFYFVGIADIYQAKLPMLMNTFESYLRNSHTARQEIALSFTNEEFTKLVQESVMGEKKPSIYSFVESGKEYLPRLTKYMMAVSYFTPLYHEDHRYLSSIMQGLIQLCPERDLVHTWEKDRDTMNSLQLCIGFAHRVQPIPIVVPGRLLLHEGEVLLIEKKKKKKIWLMLFSDILLLTRRQGKIFSTFEAPLLMDQLIVQDLNCSEVTEFQISATNGTLNRLMRTHSLEEKTEWMQKLKERAAGSVLHKRRPGDKMPRISNLPKIDAPRKSQSQPMASPASTTTEEESGDSVIGSPMAAIPEGSVVEKQEKEEETSGEQAGGQVAEQSSRRLSHQLGPTQPMPRGRPKRRSLFSMSARADRHTGRGEQRKDKKSKRSSPTRQLQNLDSISVEVLKEWEGSFDTLLKSPDGIVLFEEFLKSEFSEENIQFWRACERHKGLPQKALKKEAEAIFEEYISQQASKLVNIDHQTTKEIIENMKSPNRETFARAQQSIYLLMARDSFVRFVKSEPFQTALTR